MLAARDQENFAHAQQSAAAAKSLNQGIRALHPKTPFRCGLNDENQFLDLKGQKTVRGDGGSKLDKNLFVTPGPRRDRAPLGQKTTNAKGAAFKTPAPLKQAKNPGQTIKRSSTSRRSAKSKIHVATEPLPAPVIQEQPASDSEPDYGYAPPKVPDLADPPLEITYDESFSQFKGKNIFKAYGHTYCVSPTDENGVSIRAKEEERRARRVQEERLKEADKAAAEAMKPVLPTDDELDAKVDEMIARVRPKTREMAQGVATVQAKSAAAVLSEYSSAITTSRPKLPSAATKQTAASALKRHEPTTSIYSLLPSRSRPVALTPSHSGPRLNVSKNTIGFPKAKPAPRITPAKSLQPLQARSANKATTTASNSKIVDQDSIHPKDFVRLYGQPPVGSRMHERLIRHDLLEEELKLEEQQEAEAKTETKAPLFDDDLDQLLRGDFAAADAEEEDNVFQLEIPE